MLNVQLKLILLHYVAKIRRKNVSLLTCNVCMHKLKILQYYTWIIIVKGCITSILCKIQRKIVNKAEDLFMSNSIKDRKDQSKYISPVYKEIIYFFQSESKSFEFFFLY